MQSKYIRELAEKERINSLKDTITPQGICNEIIKLWYKGKRNASSFHNINSLFFVQLTYMVYGYYLGKYGSIIFSENITCSVHGPVVLSLYHEFKRPIIEENENQKFSRYFRWNETNNNENPKVDKQHGKAFEIINKVIERHREYSVIRLRDEVTSMYSPWAITFRSTGLDSDIDDDLLFNYFVQKIREDDEIYN